MAPRISFTNELEALKNELIKMQNLVEESLNKALTALMEKNVDLCKEIMQTEEMIDDFQDSIEKRCLNLIARQQPLAGDLRLISSAMKIVTDVERVGDHAYDIAEITLRVVDESPIAVPSDISVMMNFAKDMFSRAVDAFIRQDIEQAKQVCLDDDHVDALFNSIILDLVNIMKNDSSTISQATNYMFVVKYLERIGDHATNICEWVVFKETGEMMHTNTNPK